MISRFHVLVWPDFDFSTIFRDSKSKEIWELEIIGIFRGAVWMPHGVLILDFSDDSINVG